MIKPAYEFNEGYDYIDEVMIEFVKAHLKALFEEIKHGDQEHQDWLENKIKEYSREIK